MSSGLDRSASYICFARNDPRANSPKHIKLLKDNSEIYCDVLKVSTFIFFSNCELLKMMKVEPFKKSKYISELCFTRKMLEASFHKRNRSLRAFRTLFYLPINANFNKLKVIAYNKREQRRKATMIYLCE